MITRRRTFWHAGLGAVLASRAFARMDGPKMEQAADYLAQQVESSVIDAAAIHAEHRGMIFQRHFGSAKSVDAIFLLASISKPICAAALVTLCDDGELSVGDRVSKFIPEFTGDGRDEITVEHLLTHTCGLPDQLPQNKKLRQQNAPLADFVQGAIETPLRFEPGSKYSYSSMGILIASEVARRITKIEFPRFVDEKIFQPLGMKHSSLGLGPFKMSETVRSQVEDAAPESGAGEPSTMAWDWNSEYWRRLGAPWGGAFGSAPDVAKFFREFLHPTGKILKSETIERMRRNQNPTGLASRGLGFDVGSGIAAPSCSGKTFGHTGATGTIAWSDPESDTTCVILTTLPSRAVKPHPRDVASELVADAIQR